MDIYTYICNYIYFYTLKNIISDKGDVLKFTRN